MHAKIVTNPENTTIAKVSKGSIKSIQILRAIAALAVVFWHSDTAIYDIKIRQNYEFLEFPGVNLFFVISGFIICHIGFKKDLTVKEFWGRRLIRILPIYWIFTIITVIIGIIKPSAAIASRSHELDSLFYSFFALPQIGFPVLGVGWTLEHEFLFYAVFATLMLIGQQKNVLFVILVLGGIGATIRYSGDIRFWDFHLLSLFWLQFTIGVFIWHLQEWFITKHSVIPTFLLFSGITLIGLDHAFFVKPPDQLLGIAGDTSSIKDILVIGFACGLIMVAGLQMEIMGLFSSRLWDPLIDIGNASFTLYLSHQLVFILMKKIINRANLNSLFFVESARFSAILLAVIFSLWFFKKIERPLLKRLQPYVH